MFAIKNLTDESLIQAISEGGRQEEKAIRFLISKDFGKIKSLILNRSGSEADAEDVFQEGITALILNIRKGKFKGESSIHTYLFSICKGIWYKRFKKHVRDREYKDQLQVVEEDFHTPEISFLESEQKDLLKQVFGMLREKCSEVLYMWASDYSMQEIAEKLSYGSAQAAMNKKSKCMKQMHEMLIKRPDLQQLVQQF